MASPGGYSSGNPSGINSPSVHSGVKRLSEEDRQRLANMLRALQLQQQAHAEAQPPAPAEGGAERPAEAGEERSADMAVDAPACAQAGERERQGRDMAGANGEAGGTWSESPSSPPPGGAMREMADLFFVLRPSIHMPSLLPPHSHGNNSRKDILEIVRKHSGALVWPAASQDGAGAEAAQTALMMDRQYWRYWREMMDLFFELGPFIHMLSLLPVPFPHGNTSRKDILEIVRKHSGALVRPAASRDGAGAEAAQTALMMDRQYWREMADLFFVRGVQLRGDATQDGSFRDVVFFVRDEVRLQWLETALMIDRQYWREMADLFFVRGVQLRGDATQDGSFRDVVFFVRALPLVHPSHSHPHIHPTHPSRSPIPLTRPSIPLTHPAHLSLSHAHPSHSPIPLTYPSHPHIHPTHPSRSPIPLTRPSIPLTHPAHLSLSHAHPSHSPIPLTYPSHTPIPPTHPPHPSPVQSPAATPRQADGGPEGTGGMAGREEGMEAVERRRPYFARRRQSSLREILGGSGESIDWRRTFYLNLICHTDYSLTIAVCRSASPPHAVCGWVGCVGMGGWCAVQVGCAGVGFVGDPEVTEAYPNICFAIDSSDRAFESVVCSVRFPMDPEVTEAYPNICFAIDSSDHAFESVLYSVRIHVPSLANLPHRFPPHLHPTSTPPLPPHHTPQQDPEVTEAYPNICFAIDSSDRAFESVVLKGSDHCFCVLLSAHRGAAFPAQDTVEKTLADGQRRVLQRGTSNEAKVLGEASGDGPKVRGQGEGKGSWDERRLREGEDPR
ncbi:unnamed protein product [Closterium sp. Yama58-4]|nr:unnamed protein product [Closterium sp. Yama58-4]